MIILEYVKALRAVLVFSMDDFFMRKQKITLGIRISKNILDLFSVFKERKYTDDTGKGYCGEDIVKVTVADAEFIDEEPNYSRTYNSSRPESDNFFLREGADYENLDIYYRIIPEGVPVSDVRILFYEGISETPMPDTLFGETEDGKFKTGDNLHVTWTPPMDLQDDSPGFYRVQLEIYDAGLGVPIFINSIDDGDTQTPGWQCPDDGLAIHDLVWKHRPIVYMGTEEEVGPPQHPFNDLMRPYMRHKNGDGKNPDSDVSLLPEPDYNEFGAMADPDFNYENFLSRSDRTVFPYIDIYDTHRQEPNANATLFYYNPSRLGKLMHENYAFMQFWMYEPSSHGVYNYSPFENNDFNHEGDWEMCQFTIRLRNPDDPDKKKYWVEPFAATASQHYYGQTILWDRRNNGSPDLYDQDYVRHANDGDRVKIYIAQNAHATYFRDGDIDSDIDAGCGTQVQYDSSPDLGFDRINAEADPTFMKVLPIGTTRIFDWKGRWGQQTWHWYGWVNGPQSPSARSVGIGSSDSVDPDRIYMAQDPIRFHEKCRKSSKSGELELR